MTTQYDNNYLNSSGLFAVCGILSSLILVKFSNEVLSSFCTVAFILLSVIVFVITFVSGGK